MTQVQQQIDKLRISQMEKQLQLKEASTRRKILALKQQLQSAGSKPPSTAPAKPFTEPDAVPQVKCDNASIQSSKSDDVMMTSRSEKLPNFSDLPIQQPPPLVHKVQLQKTTLTATPLHSANKMNIYTGHSRKTSESSRTKPHIPVEVNTFSQDVTSSRQTSSRERSAIGGGGATNLSNKEAANQEIGALSRLSDQQKCRQKLTLPEEIKETEYMSAIQRQKARVSRIRRCIVAATVIQRAWRDYKDEKLN